MGHLEDPALTSDLTVARECADAFDVFTFEDGPGIIERSPCQKDLIAFSQ